MVLAPNLSKYYLDFQNKSFKSAMAMFHQRFSTNTFPSWQLAQPFRYLCHNGEINTVQGNKNWINSRKHKLESKYLGKDISKIWPVIEKNPWSSKASDRIFIELESPFSISTKESSGICLFIIKKAVLNRL